MGKSTQRGFLYSVQVLYSDYMGYYGCRKHAAFGLIRLCEGFKHDVEAGGSGLLALNPKL